MTHSSSSHSNPSKNPAASQVGRTQGFRHCCEVLASDIHDEAILADIKTALTEHKRETRKRCETIYKPEIMSGKFIENDIDEMARAEEEAIQYVIELLIV